MDIRWDAGSSQHLGLHGVEAFTLTDAQLDLHPVVGVVLEEEAVVDDKLGIGPRAIKDVDLQEGHIISVKHKLKISCRFVLGRCKYYRALLNNINNKLHRVCMYIIKVK